MRESWNVSVGHLLFRIFLASVSDSWFRRTGRGYARQPLSSGDRAITERLAKSVVWADAIVVLGRGSHAERAVLGGNVLSDTKCDLLAHPERNFGSSIALIVGSRSNIYLKFSLANLGSGINGNSISASDGERNVQSISRCSTILHRLFNDRIGIEPNP
jgi:hypothetical protein